MGSGVCDRLSRELNYALNDLTASYHLDLIWLRDKYKKRGALNSREYAVALVVLLDELTDESVKRLAPKLHETMGESSPDQVAAMVDAVAERYCASVEELLTTVLLSELTEHGLTLELDRVPAFITECVRRTIRVGCVNV